MSYLTIKIEDISEGKQKAFKAVIPELNNSIICADSIAEIFELVPEVMKSSKKNKIGIFGNHKKRVKI